MAQGKAYNQEEVIRTLEPFFKLGCNIKKACEYAGVPYTTVHTWVSNDEELRIQITAWQNEMSTIARKNWKNALDRGEINSSINWLSKTEKDEFSDRIEQTGKDGQPLFDDDNKDKAKKAITDFVGGDAGSGEEAGD